MSDDVKFEVLLDNGLTARFTADEIRARLDEGPVAVEDGWQCLVCDKVTETRGAMGPHMAAHRRVIGDRPAKPKPKPKKKPAKTPTKTVVVDTTPIPNRAEMPPLYETLSGVLFGYVGPQIPTSMVAEVGEWMASTEALINALTRKDT